MKPTNRISNSGISETRKLLGNFLEGDWGTRMTNERHFFVSEIQQCYHFLTFSLSLGQIALRNVGQRKKEIYQQIIASLKNKELKYMGLSLDLWFQASFQRLTISGWLPVWEPMVWCCRETVFLETSANIATMIFQEVTKHGYEVSDLRLGSGE